MVNNGYATVDDIKLQCLVCGESTRIVTKNDIFMCESCGSIYNLVTAMIKYNSDAAPISYHLVNEYMKGLSSTKTKNAVIKYMCHHWSTTSLEWSNIDYNILTFVSKISISLVNVVSIYRKGKIVIEFNSRSQGNLSHMLSMIKMVYEKIGFKYIRAVTVNGNTHLTVLLNRRKIEKERV